MQARDKGCHTCHVNAGMHLIVFFLLMCVKSWGLTDADQGHVSSCRAVFVATCLHVNHVVCALVCACL